MSIRLVYSDLIEVGYQNRFVSAVYPVMFFTIENFEEVKHRIVSCIDRIDSVDFSKLSADGGGTGSLGTTRSHSVFNLFDMRGLEDLRVLLKEACCKYQEQVFGEQSDLIQKCWGNKIGSLEFLGRHAHVFDNLPEANLNIFSLHLTVKSDENNFTVYTPASNAFDKNPKANGSYFSRNIEGMVTVFPSTLSHYTTPNVGDDFRYSLAMDVTGEKLSNPTNEYRYF